VVFYKEIVAIALSPECVVFNKEIVVIKHSRDGAITAVSL
jgi:hypothetical protein